MGNLHIIGEKEIMQGRTTDIYFKNTKTILEKIKKSKTKVVADFTVSKLPMDWPWAVFCGLEEVINLMAGKKIDLYSIPEGTIFPSRDSKGILLPLITIEGHYGEFCIYETPILGLLCQASGIATRTSRIREIVPDSQMLSFGIRRTHPSTAYMVDRACYLGGCDTVSCIASAEALGIKPRGTMPHALTVISGDPEKGFRAFDKNLPKDVPRIALVDTYLDEVSEALTACEAIPNLEGVRLDTPASRRGNFPQIIQEVRWELDIRGYENVKIYVSGGINEDNIKELKEAGADGFGIGTSIVNAPVLDIAMDIVEMEGKPVAKRGKFSGKKQVLQCPECLSIEVQYHKVKQNHRCEKCRVELKEIMKKYISDGKIIQSLPKVEEIKHYIKEQLDLLKPQA